MKIRDINHLHSLIEREKISLIAQVKKEGLYENFGHKEVLKIKDVVYSQWQIDDPIIFNRAIDLVNSFDDWAMNYTPYE